jgi:flavin-binding protein dodecin
MLKMIEVVGISAEGFSEAAAKAIGTLIAQGEKIHFFQVVEQRGSVRDGKLKEFQAIIKVAIET